MSRHPAEGDIRASLDGELPILRRVQVGMHVRGCPHCSERLERLRLASARTTKLLATVSTSSDMSDSWHRVNVRANPHPAFAGRATRAFPGRGMALAGALGAAVLLLMTPWSRGAGEEPIVAGQVVQDVCCGDHNGDGVANEGVLHFITENGRQSVSVTYSDRDRSGSFSTGDVVHSVYKHPRAD